MTDRAGRPAYLDYNQALIEDFRAHGGEASTGPFVGRPVLLLTTRGARSGEPRTTPVVYSRDGERYVIVASKSGAPTDPAWFANLRAQPRVTLEVGTETFPATAAIAEEPERRRLYDRHAAIHPAFREYEQRTSRVIPVVTLERDRSDPAR